MNEKSSLLKNLRAGDLVYYKIKPEGWDRSTEKGAIDLRRIGLIVELEKETGMGFQMIRVLWDDDDKIDCIAENYLHKIDEA
jgi:hypothetical protein